MNEEELKEMYKELKRNKKIIESIDVDFFFEFAETVLNLLEKKDKQIKQYQNMLAINDMLHVIECEKKDNQIEYMANFINDNTPYTKDTRILENERGVRNTKYTEQYFKEKVEG